MSSLLRNFVCLLASSVVLATNDNYTRIINGNVASSAPYQVRISIRVGSQAEFCGGVVLSASYILTAAHCCSESAQQGQSVSDTYTITAGTLLRSSGGETRTADQLYLHPQWDNTDLALQKGYDLCILHLSAALPLKANIQPISIANSNPTAGTQVRVTGWGSTVAYASGTSVNAQLPENLLEATLTVLSPATVNAWFTSKGGTVGCYPAGDVASTYDYNGIIPTGNVAEPVYDPCQGDSGGPIAVKNTDNTYSLVGAVSHGYGCGQPSIPSFQASVVNSKAWVQQVMNGGTGLTLCDGRTCGPGAQCSGSTCVCKTGYYKAVPTYVDPFGFTCRRWLNGGTVQVLNGYNLLYEVVPTNYAWGSDFIRPFDAPDGVSDSLTSCGFPFYPVSASEASLVTSQLTSYISTAGLSMPPNSQIWTAVGQGTDGMWRFYLSTSASAVFTTTLWATGEPDGGQCAAMSVSGSNTLDAISCTTETWFIIRYAASASSGSGTASGTSSGSGSGSGAITSDIPLSLLAATTAVFLFIHM